MSGSNRRSRVGQDGRERERQTACRASPGERVPGPAPPVPRAAPCDHLRDTHLREKACVDGRPKGGGSDLPTAVRLLYDCS